MWLDPSNPPVEVSFSIYLLRFDPALRVKIPYFFGTSANLFNDHRFIA